MKYAAIILPACLLLPILIWSQTGASCADPIPITMDGVCRNYTVSSATGSNLVCTASGTTPITYFSVTSNASAQEMLLKIAWPTNQPVEVAFYHSTSCTNGNLEAASSICFYDGHGDWAPAPDFVITPNTTYILRIKTPTTGTIQICGKHYTAPNNSCATAMPIGPVLTFDNNATNKPGTGIAPAGLCAADIDNTAFYVYTVDVTGPTTVSVENMDLDNNYQSDLLNLGYKVGVFTGTCGSLTSVACYLGVANATLVVGSLPAGTKVYVVVDGILGSNCDYGIRAINSVSILSADLKYFTGLKAPQGNILKWVSLNERDNAFFEIERSVDGINYAPIYRVVGQGNSKSEKNYEFVDLSPAVKSFYRLKMISGAGQNAYSNVVRVDRELSANSKLIFGNVVTNQLGLQINDVKEQNVSIKIVDEVGREIYRQNTKTSPGDNLINITTTRIATGFYYLLVSRGDYRETLRFVKR
jgi:hypothetical protein